MEQNINNSQSPEKISQEPREIESKNANLSEGNEWVNLYIIAGPICLFLSFASAWIILLFLNIENNDLIGLFTLLTFIFYIALLIIYNEKKRKKTLSNDNQLKNRKWNKLSIFSAIILTIFFIQLPFTLKELPQLTANGTLTTPTVILFVSLLFLVISSYLAQKSYKQIHNTAEKGLIISILSMIISSTSMFFAIIVGILSQIKTGI